MVKRKKICALKFIVVQIHEDNKYIIRMVCSLWYLLQKLFGATFQVFGVPLADLPTGESNIPIVVDRLITTIEMTGLYTEGLYRKSGLSSKVRLIVA